MNQHSDSKPDQSVRPWLDIHYDKRKQRTLELVKLSVDTLRKQGKEVTISSVSNISKELDPDCKGIHPNTLRTNPEAHQYYSKYNNSFKRKQIKKSKLKNSSNSYNFEDIKMDRDLATVRSRYNKLTKSELIERLIQAEQYITDNRHAWIEAQFRIYSLSDNDNE